MVLLMRRICFSRFVTFSRFLIQCRRSSVTRHCPVCFTAIQPSGVFHIGNYFGAVEPVMKLADASPMTSVYLSVADLHAFTDHLPAATRKSHMLDMAASLLACELDTDRISLFVQSAIPQHTLLAQLLSSYITLPHLQRQGHYKEKSSRYQEKAVPLSLLTYPVLQAADILLYKATVVPVGKDQWQHVQIAQFLQRVFNRKFGHEFFPYPTVIDEYHLESVASLRDADKKMSKSHVSAKSRIEITDTPDLIAKKIRIALTDFTSEVFFDKEDRPAVSNLMHLHSLVSGKPVKIIERAASELEMRMPQYKEMVSADVIEMWSPINERYTRLRDDEGYLMQVLKQGNEKAREVAEANMDEIMDIVGIKVS